MTGHKLNRTNWKLEKLGFANAKDTDIDAEFIENLKQLAEHHQLMFAYCADIIYSETGENIGGEE